jgi:hypothetical protein
MLFTPAFIFLQENSIYHKTGKKQPISRVSPYFRKLAVGNRKLAIPYTIDYSCRLDFRVRLHFFYAILAELKFVVKARFFKQIFSRTNRRQNPL